MVNLPLSTNLPIIIYFVIGFQTHIITIIVVLIIIASTIVIFVTNLAKTAKFKSIYKIFQFFDRVGVFLNLSIYLLQGFQLARQLLSYTVNQGIISKAATLVGIGNNLGHLVTRHRLITLERTIWIALQYAILGQNFQGAICPMSLRYIIKSFLRKRCTLLCLGCHSRSCRHA